jgi:hypothetical protein
VAKTKQRNYKTKLCLKRVLALLNKLILSICVLFLIVLLLIVRKLLTLVRSLNYKNTRQESLYSKSYIKVYKIYKKN